MNKKVNKYLPGNVILREEEELGALVLGDCNSAVDLSIIKPNKVKTIVSIGLEAMPSKEKLQEDIDHRFYDIHDNKQQKLSVELLDEVVNIIAEGRKKGGVLVHCYAGVSRSSSFVIAYVISTFGLGYDDAKEKVKKGRPCIHPGDGFVRQLQFYAKVIAKREQERLAALAASKKKEVKQEQPVKQVAPEPTPSERVRRGVKGAVRSAEGYSPEKIKSSVMENPNASKVQQKKNEDETKSIDIKEDKQKTERLPPIQIKQSRYEKSSSLLEIKKNIQKIEGRSNNSNVNNKLNISSIRGIYGNKTKVM